MTSETIPKSRLDEIAAGCEGVTEGPWIASGVTRVIDGERFMFVNKEPLGELLRICLPERPVKGFGATIRDQHHIARLDPQTIHAIVTELLSNRDTIEALSAKVDAEQRRADSMQAAATKLAQRADVADALRGGGNVG